MLLQRSAGQVAVLIRGTMTGWEWELDFAYNQTWEGGFGAPLHWGFSLAFNQTWPAIQEQLLALVPLAATEVCLACCCCTCCCCHLLRGWRCHAMLMRLIKLDWESVLATPQVFVAGHSLGAGVATLVAYAAQEMLAEQEGVNVSAALFAPPNVGPAGFASAFNELVNARRIAYEADVVPQVGGCCACMGSGGVALVHACCALLWGRQGNPVAVWLTS